MEKKMGRKADDFWQYVDKGNGNKCIYCGHGIPGASRIKFHLAQVTGQGIRICDKVPDEVKTAAATSLSNSSNKRVRRCTTPSDFAENNISSNSLNDSTRGKGGRKQDVFWKYVDEEKKCKYCGIEIPGASRIKFHLAQVTGGGIRSCDKVPDDVKNAAILALNSSNKIVTPFETSSDLNDNNINSNLPSSSTRGEIENDLLPTTDLVGEQFESYLDEIWEWVMRDDEMSIMGVWGMGGVGKTALLKNMHNKLLIDKHRVIWITVSQNYSTSRLQRVIARAIDENIAGEDDEMKVAARLLRAFKKMNNCVVILDDVWYHISLEDVGIPLANNGIRIIVASRLLDVFKEIDCKVNIVTLEPFYDYDDDDFTLFLKSLGDEETLSDDKRNIARQMTRTCEGLPLAIETIARSMRGKADIREWRNALSKLESPEMDYDEVKRGVIPRLKSSFDHLNDRTLQDCFLCAAFYGDDTAEYEDMTRNFVDEGLIAGRRSSEEQLDEGHSILNKLINNGLLEEKEDCPRWMHKLVWAMALNIGKESHGYLYKKKLPDQEEWKEDLRKIYLYDDEITEIPSAMLHKCPELITFRMRYYSGKEIPNNFFTNTHALKLLDLSWNKRIEGLPESISNLECLTVLLLAWCKSLRHIPSLEKLTNLRKLDLSHTAITQLPLGFEKLTNLRWLDLRGTAVKGWLDLRGTAVKKSNDLESLQMLEGIAAAFVDKDEFNACIQIIGARINSGQMRSYNLLLLRNAMDLDDDYRSFNIFDNNKIVRIDSVEYSPPLQLPTSIDLLEIGCGKQSKGGDILFLEDDSFNVFDNKIEGCNRWRSLCDVFSIQQSSNKLNISKCVLKFCIELEYLFCSSCDCILCSSLQGLSELHLEGLRSLSMLCKENKVASSFLPFSHLTKLSIRFCNGLKRLLTPVMSTKLNNLEEIDVFCCDSMEEIFSTSIDYHGHRNVSVECWSRFDEVEMDGSYPLSALEPYEVEMDGSYPLSALEPYEVVMDDINTEPINLPVNTESINLPKLKSVSLRNLHQLKRVSNGIMICGSLELFVIVNCPELECIPQIQPHFEIQVS